MKKVPKSGDEELSASRASIEKNQRYEFMSLLPADFEKMSCPKKGARININSSKEINLLVKMSRYLE